MMPPRSTKLPFRFERNTIFAVYAKEANLDDPLASVVVGERPDPVVKEGWVRVKVTHASLNRHDIFTLRGMTSQEEPTPFR